MNKYRMVKVTNHFNGSVTYKIQQRHKFLFWTKWWDKYINDCFGGSGFEFADEKKVKIILDKLNTLDDMMSYEIMY